QAERVGVPPDKLAAAQARSAQAEAALAGADREALARAAQSLDAAAVAHARGELQLDALASAQQREATELAVERANAEHARALATATRARADAAMVGLSGDLGALRAELDDEIAGCVAELSSIARELAGARATAEQAVAHARTSLEAARTSVEQARLARARAETEAGKRRETLAGCTALRRDADERIAASDRAALVTEADRLAAEFAALPTVARTVTPAELDAARAAVTAAEAALASVTDELRKAEGRLDMLRGGGSARAVERAQEAIVMARSVEQELHRDTDGWQLLRDTLRAVETEQGQHLGIALGGAIEQRLARLTDGRYARLELDRDLRTAGLRAAGEARPIEVLSEGLKEQLATLVRLAIAEHLRTMVLLDDHLAQTDPQRVDWFRDLLREVGSKVQIVVLTCRPRDYLDERELPDATGVRDSEAGRVRAIDLEKIVRRA
ncbi:MAG TPA: hypothetical protein VG755_45655, partial [Nannocystaceae bacterium]|nr:hypothetical protein [Nannocystaceae bacterium]